MYEMFSRSYVINLASRLDRRIDTQAELARIGYPDALFFPAIRPPIALPFGSIGEHGAYLSHLAVLKAAAGLRNVLIMEDDVRFAGNFQEEIRALNQLPTDWEVLYIGHQQLPDCQRVHGAGLVLVDPEIMFVGTHCYALNGPAITKLIAALETYLTRRRGHPDGGPMPVDGALNVARQQKQLKTFAFVPPLAFQRSSRSDVAELRWFDKSISTRGMVNVIRRLYNRTSPR